MGCKGLKMGGGGFGFGHICPSTFPLNVACLFWWHFIWCGNCPDTLQVCQKLFTLLSTCALAWFVLCQWPQETHDKSEFPTFPSQPRSDCIHPFYLFVFTSRMLQMILESWQKLQQRTGCRPLWDTLFPIYWVPWQFPVWPVDSVCVRPSAGPA